MSGGSAEFTHVSIRFRPTVDDDIEWVMATEQDPDNSPFIRHWSYDQHFAGIRDDNIGHFIVEETATHDRVGLVILVGVTNPDRSLEFKRIVITKKGGGVGRAAVKIIKRFAFEHLRFHRLWLEVVEGNDRATALYESEGFVTEGVHREALRQGESYRSLIVMSILAREANRVD
jgi:RimJ/RimL family protein N-acetyltransferase